MKFVKPLSFAATLVVGFLAGYCFRSESSIVDNPERPLPKRHAAIKDVAPTYGTDRGWRAPEIREMVVTNVVTVTNAPPFGGPGPRGRSPREWMEDLQKRDPARFAQMTNRMAQWRQRRLARAQANIDFLSSVNTSGWSAKAQKAHDELQNLIERREELEQSIHNPELKDDERHQLMDEMRQTNDAIRRLNSSERTTLLNETAKELGIPDSDVGDFTATVQEIFDATGGGGMGHGGGMPPPPPPGK